MTPTREDRIAEYRRRQPIAELERKWTKARGRWSNAWWSAEWLDLADARGRMIASKLRASPVAPDDDLCSPA